MGGWGRLCFHQLANSQVNLDCFGRKYSPGGPHELIALNCEAGERVWPKLWVMGMSAAFRYCVRKDLFLRPVSGIRVVLRGLKAILY